MPLRGCEGERFEIDLIDVIQKLPDGTLDSQREQLRDWIWAATLGRISLKSSVSNVFPGTVDVPLVRDDALADALHLPVGPTRSVITKTGEVLVLVEADEESVMAGVIAEAIDEEAVSLGHLPERVTVFAFEFVRELAQAKVCQLRTLDRAALQSAEQDYRAATLKTAGELEDFLAGGVDLLSAQCTASGLRVSGRQRVRTAGAPITVEHVAALAQRLGRAYRPVVQFGKSLTELSPDERSTLDKYATVINETTAGTTAEELRSIMSDGVPDAVAKMITTVDAWKRRHPKVPTAELLYSYQLQSAYDGNPGFSLDPEYSTADATRGVSELLGVMDDVQALGRLLDTWGERHLATLVTQEAPSAELLASTAAELRRVQAKLMSASADEIPLVLGSPLLANSPGGPAAARLLQSVRHRSGRQCARYDGPFAGTQAGMTFFYTDASAKFFARDWNDASPEGRIPGFESVVNHVGSTTWCSEVERPATRIWFGLRNDGYAKSRKGELRFAPAATRLFAKGSAIGNGKAETEPTASYRRFISWWNNHYSAIASWDPQYETLNQLLKWSAVVQSTRLNPNAACDFLEQVSIDRTARLSNWTQQTPNLRWSEAFREIQREDTAGVRECLPLIQSKPFEACGLKTLSGGVSAATLAEVKAKPISSATIPRTLGRIGREAKGVSVKPEGVRIAHIARNNGAELNQFDMRVSLPKVTSSVEVGTEMSQTGSRWSTDARAPVRKIEKTIEQTGTDLQLGERVNALQGTGLRITDLDRAQVHMKFEAGSEVSARTLGEGVARRMNRDGAALQDAVASLAPEADIWPLEEGRIAIRGRAPDRGQGLLIMESGRGNRGPPPGASVAFRVGSPERGAGSGWRGWDSDSVVVWIVPEKHSKPYLTDRVPLAADDTLVAVRARLAANDPASAFAALDRAPTVDAAKLLLEDSLVRKDFASAKRVVQSVRKAQASQQLAPLYEIVEKHRILHRRNGGDPGELANLSMQLAIDERHALMPEVTEAAAIAATSNRVVAPSIYSIQGALPPPIHARNAPLPPDQQYVSRIIAMPVDLEPSHPFTTLAGESYRVHASGTPRDWSWTDVGPAARVLGLTRPAVAVLRCSDDAADDRPPCHEPATLSEQFLAILREASRTIECDSDGNRELNLTAEQACGRQIASCDLNDDGAWDDAAERSCVQQMKSRLFPNHP